jgi:hypothetical protein
MSLLFFAVPLRIFMVVVSEIRLPAPILNVLTLRQARQPSIEVGLVDQHVRPARWGIPIRSRQSLLPS